MDRSFITRLISSTYFEDPPQLFLVLPCSHTPVLRRPPTRILSSHGTTLPSPPFDASMDDSSYSDDDVYEDSRSTGSGGQFEENSRRQSGRGEEGITRTTSTGEGRGQASIADKDGSTTASQTPRAVQQYCTCQRVYLEAQNSKKTLFLLAIGLMDDDGHDVFSFDNEPWSRLPKASMKPQNGEFLREINRRATLYNIQPRPRPMNCKRPRIVQWLHENPVRESDCKSFLFAEVEKLRNILLRLQVQATESAPTGTSKWRGNVPYLRVIMCLTDDHVKHLFLNRANARTRQELDGRNSENR